MNAYPTSAQALFNRIEEGFRRVLSENLVGIYLHGSLTMGGFNPRTSDIDFLVVIYSPLSAAEFRALIALTLELAKGAPQKGLEFSVVLKQHTQHFSYPTPFEFHYGLNWNDRFESGAVDYGADPRDPDLAAHFTITRTWGHCLYGEPIDVVFGTVPERDYWASILADARDILDDMLRNPPYSVLNLCRVIAYQQEKLIVSKVEGAGWALQHLPAQFHPPIKTALVAYQNPVEQPVLWDEDGLMCFARYARGLLTQ